MFIRSSKCGGISEGNFNFDPTVRHFSYHFLKMESEDITVIRSKILPILLDASILLFKYIAKDICSLKGLLQQYLKKIIVQQN